MYYTGVMGLRQTEGRVSRRWWAPGTKETIHQEGSQSAEPDDTFPHSLPEGLSGSLPQHSAQGAVGN